MGHAGAIVSGGAGTAQEKMDRFERAGVRVAKIPSEIPGLVAAGIAKRGSRRLRVVRGAPRKATKSSGKRATTGRTKAAAPRKTTKRKPIKTTRRSRP